MPKPDRPHVSVACLNCKQRRKKCAGGDPSRPCNPCIDRGLECRYDPDNDGRRSQARKRQYDEIETERQVLHGLLKTMRDCDDNAVAQVVALIRSNGSLEDVRKCVEQQQLESRLAHRQPTPEQENLYNPILQRPSNSEPSSEPEARRRRYNPLSIMHIVDTPPHIVPASPWTNVTSDDALVSSLLSAWLAWERPFNNWIDDKLFIHAMRSHSLDSKYCSSFLVNALLAFACGYSDYDEAQTGSAIPSQLMSDFLNEAVLQLADMTDVPSLTKAQGLACVFDVMCLQGNDTEAVGYLKRAISECSALQNMHAQTVVWPEADRHFSQTLDVTCWGIYNLAFMWSVVTQQAPIMAKPSRSIPEPQDTGFDWKPYPRSAPAVCAYEGQLLQQRCHLSLIVADLTATLYGAPNHPLPPLELSKTRDGLDDRLSHWLSSQPEHVKITDRAPPSVLTHQAYFWSIVMKLFVPLRIERSLLSTKWLTQADSRILQAAKKVASICRTHQALHGNTHMSGFLVQQIYLALLILVEEPNTHQYDTDVSDLCVFFRAMARRIPFAMAVFRMFQATVDSHKLPTTVEKLFEDFEAHDWNKRQLQRFRSLYPVLGKAAEDEDPQNRLMGNFLHAMEELDIRERRKVQDDSNRVDSSESTSDEVGSNGRVRSSTSKNDAKERSTPV